MKNAKNFFLGFIVGFGIGIVTFAGTFIGYNIRESRFNRVENEKLVEHYQSARSELDRVRKCLEQCQTQVQSGRDDIDDIDNAVERIRAETKILHEYYDRTSCIIGG